MNPAQPVPCDIISSLVYEDAPAAMEWLCRVFGLIQRLVVPGPNGTIIHSELSLGNGVIMVSSPKSESPRRGPGQPGGSICALCVYVADPDAHFARVESSGALILQGLRDEEYGARGYLVQDLEGHQWYFSNYRPGQFWNPPA